MKWRIFANQRGDNIDNGPAFEPGVAPTSPARKGPTMISDKLFALRRRAGMSQQEVAAAIGVSRQTVSNWEQNQGAPALDKAAELARLYGVSLNDLASDEVDVVSSAGTRAQSDLHVLEAFVGAKDATISLSGDEATIQHAEILEAGGGWLRIAVERSTALFGNPKTKREHVIRLIDLDDVLSITMAPAAAPSAKTSETEGA